MSNTLNHMQMRMSNKEDDERHIWTENGKIEGETS